MAIGTEILRYIARPLFRDAHDFWAEQYADLKADFESTGYYRTTADYWATHTLAQGGLEAIGEIDKFVQTGILKDIHDPSLAAKAGIGMAFLKFFGASSLGIADNELKIINEIPRGPAAVVYRTGEIGCEIATGVYNSGIFVFSQIAGLVDGEMARWPDGKDVYQASKEFTETGIMASAIIFGALSLVSGAGELASGTFSSGGGPVVTVSRGGVATAAIAGSETAALAGGEAIAAGAGLLMVVKTPPEKLGERGRGEKYLPPKGKEYYDLFDLIVLLKHFNGCRTDVARWIGKTLSSITQRIKRAPESSPIKRFTNIKGSNKGRGDRFKLQFSPEQITAIEKALRANKGNVAAVARDVQMLMHRVQIAISRNPNLKRILNEERAAVRSSRAEAAAQKAAAKAMKPKRGRGRPKLEFSPEQITAIENALRANKGDVVAAARDVKMSPYYVKRAISEYPELEIARDEAITAVQQAKALQKDDDLSAAP